MVRGSVVLVFIVLAGCAAPMAAPPGAPAAPVEPGREAPSNLWLLDAPRPFASRVSGGAEPSILATRDGSTILVGDVSGLYRSTDGGATWTRAPDPFLPGAFADGWALAEDDAGTLYAADTQGQVIGVAASRDKGASWGLVGKVVEVAGIADRPWLAARGDGEVVLVMNNGVKETCARSTDGGVTWLSRSAHNWAEPNAGNVVLDAQGRAWVSNGEIVQRWDAPCFPAHPRPWHLPPTGAQIFTQLALDGAGRVHLAAPSPDNGQMLLLTITSNGIRQLAVSPPELRSNTFGAIAARGDEVAVAWYGSETRGNPSQAFEGAWNVYVARVKAPGTTEQSTRYDRLTAEPNHVGGFCMGGVGCGTAVGGAQTDRDLLDYFGVAYGPDGTLHVAYGHDGAGSRAEVRYARLAP